MKGLDYSKWDHIEVSADTVRYVTIGLFYGVVAVTESDSNSDYAGETR